MAFVFQGNPNKFDIDDYLTRYPNIYWSVSRLGREIRIGDQIFIWRSGVSAGALRGGGSALAPPIIHKVVLDSFMPASRGNNSYLLQPLSSFSECHIL
jgi:hypothetical protein